ncbi:MAG TPA: GTP-binding protein, partial [Planctomycetaceae bacterium]|nr:GTP-binding protein [Planctomycetaceae bacterium]
MARYNVRDIRNVVLVGHGATGKTTLADLMLFKGGQGSRAGSVDDGTSVLDTDEEEKERKFSITSAVAHFDRDGKRINLIDAPGYPDFIGQVCGALRAVETAVIVISAGAGIEVNTRKVFQLAGEAGVGRMILVNKCDMDNVRIPELVDAIKEVFGPACVPLNVPVGSASKFSGVVSTLKLPDSIPDGTEIDPQDVHQKLMDAIVEADDELMERFLEGEELSEDEI